MKDIELAILNYENQLLENRKQLNDLICECSKESGNHQLIQDKVNYFQKEIDYMISQLYLLKTDLQKRSDEQKTLCETQMPQSISPVLQNEITQESKEMPQFENTMSKSKEIPPFENTMSKSYEIPQVQNTMPKSNGMSEVQNNEQKAKENVLQKIVQKKDLENVIGQSWMGIFASILIFISLILFATLLVPFLTDPIKMAAMYMVSVGFTVFGLIKLKQQNNKTYLAISSCGIGAIYISLLLSHLYFKAIGYLPLYVFILIWAAFVCYLSKLRDKVFQIIGQVGISIALLFGCILCTQAQDAMKLFMLSLFFVLTASVFYISSFSKQFNKNRINYIFNCLNVVQLWSCFSLMADIEKFTILAGVVIVVFLIIQFYFFLISEMKENGVSFSIFTVINVTLLLALIFGMIESEDICAGISVIVGCILLVIIDRKYNEKSSVGKNILEIYSMLGLAISVSMISVIEEPVAFAILMFPFLWLGYFRKDRNYKYGSLLMFGAYCFLNTMTIPYFCVGLMYLAFLAYFIYTKKEQYTETFKIISYLAALLFLYHELFYITGKTDADIGMTTARVVVGILNVIAMKSIFVKNFQTLQEEKISVVVTYIMNARFMLLSLSSIMEVDNEICHCILILQAVLLFVANSKNLLAKQNSFVSGIYIGIKFTVLLVTILSSFAAANYVISISAFLFAIASIVFGFGFRLKAFRIYGLILSMLSVVKLIMIDIRYDNTLAHALSFFLCGILCFTISMIYNVIDKKMNGTKSI